MILDKQKASKQGEHPNGAAGRKLFVYVSRNVYNFGVAETGRYLGISGPATSVCLREGEKLVASRDDLKREIELW